MGEFSLTHWLVIAVIGIIFFGPKRLPALGQSLGESIRGFKKAMSDQHDAPADQTGQRRDSIASAETDSTRSTANTNTKDTTRS